MDAEKVFIDSSWTLSFTHPISGEFHCIEATVPGNVEIDMQREGIINDFWPVDDFFAMRDFERVDDWKYDTIFDAPSVPHGYSVNLVFEGIDTIADVILNGEKILRCENMFIPHSVIVSGKLMEKGNTLTVRIYSADLFARKFSYNAFSVLPDFKQSQAYLRKAPHMWGWDNAPRLLSAGIWRPIHLLIQPPIHFSEVYVYTQKVRKNKTWIGVNWAFETPDTDLSAYQGRVELYYEGKLEHSFDFEVFFTYGVLNKELDTTLLKLWWPKGYGTPNLYDISVQLLKNGEAVAQWMGRIGIRELELVSTEYIDENDEGEFVFICNGEKIYINGTNWKPLDALHSLAEKKVRQALDLCLDLNCNMVRVWGGGVYEDSSFFEYCDEKGLLVWQDFMFACGLPPQDEFFQQMVKHEAQVVIKRFRNHPSLAVWCGDNEVDDTFFWGTMIPKHILPSYNEVTRKVLKEAVLRYDPYRSYIASSPFVSDVIASERWKSDCEDSFLATPEKHLYPKEVTIRTSLRACKSRFVGETGPFFINAMTENPEIVEREMKRALRLWDVPIDKKDYFMSSHQRDKYFITWKDACRKELLELFGEDFSFEPWEDFALGVNIFCGDTFKYAIEYSRSLKWKKTGVLWWSLLDMWPMMFNYSVVDYSFKKKMPYYWIRQSQQPFCLMVVEQEENGTLALYAANDTLQKWKGNYSITGIGEIDQKKEIASGKFNVAPNQNMELQVLTSSEGQMLWIIEWQIDENQFYNHFVCGKSPFKFGVWKNWNARLLEIYQGGHN